MEVIKMKKLPVLGGLILLMSLGIMGCGNAGGGEEETSPVTPLESSEPIVSSSSSSEDTTDYGKVFFKSIYIYADSVGNCFDGVPIRPTFTHPEVCENEVFEYEIAKEEICYIENDCVYALGIGTSGSTRVTAKSQHLKGTFNVFLETAYNNGAAFGTAKSLANKAAKATNQGTTLFVGDSFFEFWRNKTGIDERFDDAFAGFDVANVGINGTQAREWRSLRKALIDPYQPENLVLNIGINDVDDNSMDGESTAEYIMMLCEDIWTTNPNCNIYYCSITRCAGWFANKWPQHEKSNEIMKTNAESIEKLHYLDIMERYGSNYASYEQSDGLHPNTAGYEIFKDIIKTNVPLKTK